MSSEYTCLDIDFSWIQDPIDNTKLARMMDYGEIQDAINELQELLKTYPNQCACDNDCACDTNTVCDGHCTCNSEDVCSCDTVAVCSCDGDCTCDSECSCVGYTG